MAIPAKAVTDSIRPLRISVEIGGRVYTGDLEAETRVATDPEGLNRALAENPGRFAWWATLEVLAKTQAEEAENVRATLHAELYSFYEASLSRGEDAGKRSRPTVEAVRSAILRNPKHQEAEARHRRATEASGLMTVARRAMEQRKESLIAVASNYRAELDARMRDQIKAVRERIQRGQPSASPPF